MHMQYCVQVARIQQQVLDALRQASQLDHTVQDAIVRLNSQLFDISMVSCIALCLEGQLSGAYQPLFCGKLK